MVVENYKDTQSDRFGLGSELRVIYSLDLKLPTKIDNLFLNLNFNYIRFNNAGIMIINDNLYQGVDLEKTSLDFGIFYNFSK